MSDQWYYQLFGQEFGPVGFDDLVERLSSGEVGADDLVREGSTGRWVSAGSVSSLKQVAHQAALEMAEVATDIDSFMLIDERVTHEPELATDIDSFMVVDESSARPAHAPPSRSTATVDSQSGSGWYFQSFGQEMGPISLQELVARTQQGEIGRTDMVRQGPRGRWIVAEGVQELGPYLMAADTPSPAQSDTSINPRVSPQAKSPTPARPPAAAQPSAPGAAPPWMTGAPPAAELNWFCYMNDQEYGPVSMTELKAWVEQGQITREMYLKHGIQGEWVLAGSLLDLFAPLPEPEPEPEPAALAETATALAQAASRGNRIDEKSELVQQLLSVLKQGLSAELMSGGQLAAPTAGAGWFCNISGSVIGPVSIESLVQMVLQKRLFPDDLIRMGSAGEWFPAKSVPDLFPDTSKPGSKGKKYADEESVMDRIDRMYREGQEAQAKLDAAKAANPAKSVKHEAPRSNAAGDVLRQMNANIARGAPPKPKESSGSLNDIKLDAKTITVLVCIAVIGLGAYFTPTLLSTIATRSAYSQLLAMKAEVKKAEGSGSIPASKSKEMLKQIVTITKTMKGGATGTSKRDVSRMARAMKEMIETLGKPASPGAAPDTPTDYQRASKAFDDYTKQAGKKLGLAVKSGKK